MQGSQKGEQAPEILKVSEHSDARALGTVPIHAIQRAVAVDISPTLAPAFAIWICPASLACPEA